MKTCMPIVSRKLKGQQGFTLIEVMFSIVIGMIVLGGLLLGFLNQSNEYQYQDKRIDSVQDLEFGLRFIEEDFRGALAGAPAISIIDAVGGDPYTSSFGFYTWDTSCTSCPTLASLAGGTGTGQVKRKYQYDFIQKSLSYDRYADTGVVAEILPNVTFFKVFDDYSAAFDTTAERGGVYTGMPDPLPQISISGPSGAVTTSGYTFLIEMEVGRDYKGGSLVDVRGNIVTTKRIWRYTQVYPLTAVD